LKNEGDLSVIWERYNEMLVNRDREVRVLEPGHEYTGHAIGIDKNWRAFGAPGKVGEVETNLCRRGIGKEEYMGMYDDKVVLCGANSYNENVLSEFRILKDFRIM